MANIFKTKSIVAHTGVFSVSATAPNLVYNTGDQFISGSKNFDSRPQYHSGNLALVSELESISGDIYTFFSGYVSKDESGALYPSYNPSGYITGFNSGLFALDLNLIATGSGLNNKIDSLSGTFTGASGYLQSQISSLNISGSTSSESFESVSKNIKSYQPEFKYSGAYPDITLTGIQYSFPIGRIINKQFSYISGTLSQISLYGDTPTGILLNKNFYYNPSGTLTGVSYI